MKHYKTNSRYLGYSDIASLIVRTPNRLEEIHFGGDNDYSAWIVRDEESKIPSHYTKVFEDSNASWLDIYDDNERTFHEFCHGCSIYRAGDYGILIHLITKRKEHNNDNYTPHLYRL
jgi:hypothetical protein